MIVDEEKEKVKNLNKREREIYLIRWDNRNINPTFVHLSMIYDDILYLLKNKIYFGKSNAKFNDVIDSTMSIMCSNSKPSKRSIENWFKLYNEMKIALTMYKHK